MILLLVGASERAIGIVREVAANRIDIRSGTSPDRPDWVITSSGDERADAIRRYHLPADRVIELHDMSADTGPPREVVLAAIARITELGDARPQGSRLTSWVARHAIPVLTEWATWVAVDEAKQRIAASARTRLLIVVPDGSVLTELSGLLSRVSHEGNTAHLVVTERSASDALGMLQPLTPSGESSPSSLRGVTFGPAPDLVTSPWRPLAMRLRTGLHTSDQRGSHFRRIAHRPLAWIERNIPPEIDLVSFIEDRRPDVVVLVPHRSVTSLETDWLRAARALAIPSLCLPMRWDDLGSDGSLEFELPDAVAVWDEQQEREVRRTHNIPPDRIHVTGPLLPTDIVNRAPDPGLRERYCARLGLNTSRPIVLFEAPPNATRESVSRVREWGQAIRSSADTRVREAGLVLYVQNQDEVAAWRRIGTAEGFAIARAGEPDRAPYRLNESLTAADIVVPTTVPMLLEAAARAKSAVVLSEKTDPDADLARFARTHESLHSWPIVAHDVDDAVTRVSTTIASEVLQTDRAPTPLHAHDGETAAVRVHRLLEDLAARRSYQEASIRPSRWKRWLVLSVALLAGRRR